MSDRNPIATTPLTATTILLLVVAAAGLAAPPPAGPPSDERPPNIIFILADDLGYGELGCYGQTRIETPNIDALARAGMRFTQHYSGSPVCAPSRCTLLTGRHTGHAYVRANHEMGGWGPDEPEGQLPLPEGITTLGGVLQGRGYRTAAIGKWGLGGPGSSGHPNRQGFDHWYGYLCQRVAHNYYPTHLWRNDDKHVLEGNAYFRAHQKLPEPPSDPAAYDRFAATHYAPDLMIEEALRFIRGSKGEPFFLYFATPVPHAAIQVPSDSLQPYLGRWEETPYLGQKGYLPHRAPRAGYAAMVTRFDRDVGRITALLDALGLADHTVVMLSSDNGPTFNGGTDSEFFRSAGPLRGLKTMLYEGGIRVPLIVRYPGRVAPGSETDHVSAFWDVLPTACDLAGIEPPPDIDGISMLPTLLGREEAQSRHDHLYWEYRGGQAVRRGDWKAIRRTPERSIELYDLAEDVGEERDVAGEHPELVRTMAELMRTTRTESEHFPLQKKKKKKEKE